MMVRRAVAGRLLWTSWFALTAATCADKQPPPAQTAATAATTSAAPGVPSGPPVELVAAAVARPHLLGTISIASVDRVLENGAKLASQAVPLPMDAKGLRDMLLSQAGLQPDVAANIDFTGPCSVAFVAIGDKGEAGTVIAVPARGSVEAQRLIDALGKPVMVRGQVTLVRSPGSGSGWFYRTGNVVVLSDELEALSRGAMLALEARRAGSDDITGVVYPDAIARARGTDVKAAIARIITEMRNQKATTGAPAASGPDPARGLVLHGRLLARAGTRLETVAKEVRPFTLDPTVLGDKRGRFVMGASSLGPFWRGVFATYRDRLAADKQKGAQAALAYLDATLAAMAGDTSGGMWLQKDTPHLGGVFASPLKDDAAAAKVGATMASMDQAAFDAFMRSQVGNQKLFDWSAKKESVGKLKTIHYRVKIKQASGKAGDKDAEPLRRFLGPAFDVYWAVAGKRLLITMGRDAKQKLTALAAGTAAAPAETTGPFADALAAAKGRDTFYYLDLAPVLSLAGSLSDEPRMAMLARGGTGPIPMVITAGGDGAGKAWSADVTLPVAAFTSVGALIAAGMGGAR